MFVFGGVGLCSKNCFYHTFIFWLFGTKSYFLSLFDTFLTFYAKSHVLTSFFPKSFPWQEKSMFSRLKAFARRARRLEAIPIIIIKNEAVSVPTSRMFCPANVQIHLDDYKTIWIWQEHDKDQSFPPINPTFNQSRMHECSPSAEEAGAKPRPSTQSKCSSERMSSWPVLRLLLWTLLGGWKTWRIVLLFCFGVVADGMLPKNPNHSMQLTNLSQSTARKSLPWPVDLGAQKRRAHWKHIAQTMSWTSLNPQSSDPTPPTSKATMSTKMDEVHRLWERS